MVSELAAVKGIREYEDVSPDLPELPGGRRTKKSLKS